MPPELASLLSIVGTASLVAFAGGLVPVFHDTSARLRGYLLHLAAGVLSAVVAVKIWPEIRHLDQAGWTIGGLLAGAAAMIALNAATRWVERHRAERSFGLIACAWIDSAVDGLLIGIGYAADPDLGMLLAAGLAIEKFTTNITVAAEAREDGLSRAKVAACVGAIAFTLVPAAMAGKILLGEPRPEIHAFLLSIAAAALLYVVIAELIARGQEEHNTTPSIMIFFAGFVGIAGYAMLSGA